MTSAEFKDRLTGHLPPGQVALTSEVVAKLEAYYRLLARWNEKINLTALPLRPPTGETFDRLLVEPLIAAHQVEDSALVWFDLGSGGGSPAIPLKILRPRAKLVMVESKARKAAFLREAVRLLELPDVHVENGRAEEIASEVPGRVQIVTIRAVKADSTLLSAAKELLSPGGRLLWFRSTRAEAIGVSDLQTTKTVVLSATAQLDVLIVVPRGTK